jgi:TrmH family RNA methyltransferase
MIQTISSRHNPKVAHVKRLTSDRSYRYAQQQVVCEGIRTLEDCQALSVTVLIVFFRAGTALPPLGENVELFEVPQAVIEAMSDLKTPPSLLFTAKMPNVSHEWTKSGRHILLDDLQDPGNVGTILRSAEAFAMAGVIFTSSTVDPFGPKALRASMGSGLRVHLTLLAQEFSPPPIPIYALDMDSESLSSIPPGPLILAVGQEGRGLSQAIRSLAVATVCIPMKGPTQSLNAGVAASIACYELSQNS